MAASIIVNCIVEENTLTANEQADGILLDLIRYVLNIATVVGSIVLVAGLLFIMVTRAHPGEEASASEEQAAQAPAAPTATEAPAGEAAASAASPEVIAKGQALFQDQGCTACHTIEGVPQAVGVVGPSLTDIGVRAEERAKEAGVADAEAYIRRSVVEPNAFIAPECPSGPCPPGTMPQNFDDMLSEEQLNALVQFLLAQTGG